MRIRRGSISKGDSRCVSTPSQGLPQTRFFERPFPSDRVARPARAMQPSARGRARFRDRLQPIGLRSVCRQVAEGAPARAEGKSYTTAQSPGHLTDGSEGNNVVYALAARPSMAAPRPHQAASTWTMARDRAVTQQLFLPTAPICAHCGNGAAEWPATRPYQRTVHRRQDMQESYCWKDKFVVEKITESNRDVRGEP
jgi:hypothetical protein